MSLSPRYLPSDNFAAAKVLSELQRLGRELAEMRKDKDRLDALEWHPNKIEIIYRPEEPKPDSEPSVRSQIDHFIERLNGVWEIKSGQQELRANACEARGSDVNIAELRRLHAAATLGDWRIHPNLKYYVLLPMNEAGDSNLDGNAAFIVAAHNAMPALLDRLERLESEAANG